MRVTEDTQSARPSPHSPPPVSRARHSAWAGQSAKVAASRLSTAPSPADTPGHCPPTRRSSSPASSRGLLLAAALLATGLSVASPAEGQEARRRWERMCQIRAEKFDLVLPGAMRDNDLDMWLSLIHI